MARNICASDLTEAGGKYTAMVAFYRIQNDQAGHWNNETRARICPTRWHESVEHR